MRRNWFWPFLFTALLLITAIRQNCELIAERDQIADDNRVMADAYHAALLEMSMRSIGDAYGRRPSTWTRPQPPMIVVIVVKAIPTETHTFPPLTFTPLRHRQLGSAYQKVDSPLWLSRQPCLHYRR